jgi:hypothetical protein
MTGDILLRFTTAILDRVTGRASDSFSVGRRTLVNNFEDGRQPSYSGGEP